MQDDRHSLPVKLLHQWKMTQGKISDITGLDRGYLSNVLSGKMRWRPELTEALTQALNSKDKADVLRGAALDERRQWLTQELEVVSSEQAAS